MNIATAAVAASLVVAPAAVDPEAAEAGGERPAATTPAVAEDVRPLRIAVYELELSSVPEHWGRVVMASLLTELRKLDKTSVIGMDEIRAMLGHEANKQLMGCEQESCLSEIADALGVDVLVIGGLARVADEHIFSLRRIDQLKAQVKGGVTRRFKAGNGEEFLVAIGPAVAELFPDRPLRPGMKRGVAKEMALRLNPPPLPAWVFWTGVGAASVAGLGAATFGVWNLSAVSDLKDYKANARPFVRATFEEKAALVDSTAYATFGFLGGALALGLATGMAGFFTDFWGYAEMNEEAQR